MAGSYGWHIDASREFLQQESGGYQMPMPMPCPQPSEEDPPSSDPEPEPEFELEPEPEPEPEPDETGPSYKGYYWCEARGGAVHPEAIKAGVDKDGGNIFIGRAHHEGEVMPAKITPNYNCAFVSYGGQDHGKDEYEVLCRGTCSVIWQECEGGVVPSNAVAAGRTRDDERLYVGRVFHDGTHTPGKVHPSHGVCYIAYNSQELSFSSYEVLVLQ